MNETVLIAKSEKFLSHIQEEKFRFSEISNLDCFIEIYDKLKQNLEELHDLREIMEMKGYMAPYRSLTRYGPTSTGEVMVEELQETSRHSQYFRMKAAAKKNILDRIKSSISSHKIALGNLEEYGIIKCNSCSKNYHLIELKANYNSNLKCRCGSSVFTLEINETGVFRLDILPYLPLSGDYMLKMSHLSSWGRESFKKIIKVLKQERKGAIKTISLVIKVMESGRWIRKRVTINAEDKTNYEKELRKKYGSDMRIEFLQFHRKKPAIINDRHTRTALGLAYVQFAERIVSEIGEDLYSSYLQDKNQIELYDHLLVEARSMKLDPLEEMDDLEEVQEQKLYELLKKNDLLNKVGELKRSLAKDLKSRERFEKKIFPRIGLTLIVWDIIKYYLTNSYDRRNKYSGPFPYLRLSLDRKQIKVFEDFDKEVVDVLKTFKKEKIEYIPHIQQVLAEKFKLEQKLKGLHIKINPAAFGAAVVNLESKLSLEKCSKLFSVSPDEIEAEKKNIELVGKPQSPKALKFLEMIKK